MKFAPFRALFAALQIPLLLSMQLAEGTGMHHCSEHDAGVGAGASAMMMHQGHHTGSDHRQHNSCHCIGVCCQATLVYSPPVPIAVLLAVAPVTLPRSVPVTSLRDSVRLLPFAIGPPTSA
jgi:hypothetical protein